MTERLNSPHATGRCVNERRRGLRVRPGILGSSLLGDWGSAKQARVGKSIMFRITLVLVTKPETESHHCFCHCQWNKGVNQLRAYYEILGDMSKFWERRERRLPCEQFLDFIGATGSRPSGWGEYQPSGTLPLSLSTATYAKLALSEC